MWPFKSEAPVSPNAVVHTPVIGGARQIPGHIRHTSALRRQPTKLYNGEQSPKRGMWVVYKDKVGILTDLLAGDIATLNLVDAAGLNLENGSITCQASELRQAQLAEIPAPRRPSVDFGHSLGYV